MEYRRNPPLGDKVTEATVAAHIKSNEELVNLKEGIMQKEYERNITRTTSNTSSPLALRRRKQARTSEESERLHHEWQVAQENLNYEEENIQVLQGKQVIYALDISSLDKCAEIKRGKAGLKSSYFLLPMFHILQ